MERKLSFRAPRDVALVEYDERAPAAGEVLLRTLYSGISAGTELTQYRGTNPHATRAWDAERRLFVEEGTPRDTYPLDGFAYEQVGLVVEVGDDVDAVAPGDVAWGVWGHRSSAILPIERVEPRLLGDLPPLAGVFPRIGAVALNAVLDADIHVGETVAIWGQGVVGLIATQLAAANGATVVAVDRILRRRELARSLGAAHVVDAADAPAETVKELTRGRGADVSIELSGSYAALHEAIRGTAYASRVVHAGFAQGDAGALRLGEEFHHNRIELVASQISSVAPRLAHRWSPLRLERTIVDLRARGRLQLEPLVSHVVPLEQAAEAYRLLDEVPEEAVQIVLEFA